METLRDNGNISSNRNKRKGKETIEEVEEAERVGDRGGEEFPGDVGWIVQHIWGWGGRKDEEGGVRWGFGVDVRGVNAVWTALGR